MEKLGRHSRRAPARARQEPATTAAGRVGPRRVAAAAAVAAATIAVLAVLAHTRDVDADQAGATTPVLVSFDAHHPGARVPERFLGLSFEVSSLRQIAAWADRGNFVRMLRSLGPGVLRFGGVSADTRVAWTDASTPRPPWATWTIEESDFRALARLAARSGWKVLLTVGLIHYEPFAAAREAAAAKRALGRALAGIEIGNEPDAYALHNFRSTPWTFAAYSAEARGYRSAIRRAAGRIPLVGPDVSGSGVFARWGRGEARRLKPALLTGHHYPLGCRQDRASTLSALLSPLVRYQEQRSLRRYLSVSRAAGLRFRMDETNSVSCGGMPGVSNTFASTLWAASYITRAMAAGVAGVNLHANPANCSGYAPLCAETAQRLADGDLRAQPEWFALLLASALRGDRVLPSFVNPNTQENLELHAFLARDGTLRILVVDEDPPGTAPTTLSMRLNPGRGAASVLRLTAPAPDATADVQIAGRPAADYLSGTPRAPEQAPNQAGTVEVAVAPSSVVLITLPARVPAPLPPPSAPRAGCPPALAGGTCTP